MNYYGTGRTNYVSIKDVDSWKELCQKYNLRFLKSKDSEKVGFHSELEDGFPESYTYDEELEEDVLYPDFMEAFSELLEDGEVLIWMHTGNEGFRYLVGEAFAINNQKARVELSLKDIYEKAKTLGKNITNCDY